MFALVLLAWINDNTKYRVHGVLNINDQTSSNYLDKFLLDLMHARDAPEGGPRGSAGGSGNCDNFTGKSRKIRQRFRGSPISLLSTPYSHFFNCIPLSNKILMTNPNHFSFIDVKFSVCCVVIFPLSIFLSWKLTGWHLSRCQQGFQHAKTKYLIVPICLKFNVL